MSQLNAIITFTDHWRFIFVALHSRLNIAVPGATIFIVYSHNIVWSFVFFRRFTRLVSF